MHEFHRNLGVLLGAFLSLAVADLRPALGDDRDTARKKAIEGAALYAKRDYLSALRRFEAAYALYPSPKLHYNLGLALAGLGRNADAYAAFQRFVAESDDSGADHIAHARQELARLRNIVGRVTVTCDVVGAEVTIDGSPKGRTPLGRPVAVEAGTRNIVMRLAGYKDETVRVNIGRGETRQIRAVLHPTRAKAGSDAPPAAATAGHPVAATHLEPLAKSSQRDDGAKTLLGWSMAGVGVATAGAGFLMYKAAGRKLARIEEVNGGSRNYDPANDNWRTYDRLGIGLIVAGVSTAAVGGTLVWLGHRDRRVAVGAFPLRSGGAAVVRGAF